MSLSRTTPIAGSGNAYGSVIERLHYSASGDFAYSPTGGYARGADADANIDLFDFANLQVRFGTTVPATTSARRCQERG